jgi:hypothetical protein
MKDFIPFPNSTPSLSHTYFSHFGDTSNLGSNGFTKLKESLLSLIPFWKAILALVLECYKVHWLMVGNIRIQYNFY